MFKGTIRNILIQSTLIALMVFAGCDDDPSENASRLRLKLTDETSFVIRELQVDIREISVFLVDTVTQEGEWLKLNYGGRTYDVLKLSNGKMTQLVEQYVPAGTKLTQIKLLFGGENLIRTNTDSIVSLQIPPELEEGVIIDAMEMEMRLNTISSMVIDLNASMSIQTTNNKDFYLYPVARAFPEVFGGKLRGYTAPLGAAYAVGIIQGTDTLFTIPELEKRGDQVEMFQFIGLKEGEWEVHVLARPGSGFQDTTFVSTVELGKTTDITPKPIRLTPIPEE